MKPVASLLLFVHLSTQLPWPLDSSANLVAREQHSYSPHTTKLKRSTQPQASIKDDKGAVYLLPVMIGNQTFQLQMDTGSADIWVIQTGYTCYNNFNATAGGWVTKEPYSHCNNGPSYTPDASFKPLSGIDEFVSYGQSSTRERALGTEYGTVPVEAFGLKIESQIVGVPINTSQIWHGEKNIVSGILGMGPSSLTAAQNASGPTTISSVMNSLFNVDKTNPPLAKKFSIALSRDKSQTGNGGSITIGGIPSLHDPTVNVSSTTPASTPILIVPEKSNTTWSYYQIKADYFTVGSEKIANNTKVIIDSGAPEFELPTKSADAINALWSPAVSKNGTLACHAVIKEPIGVSFGGTTFHVQSSDLIITNDDGTCQSAVQACSGTCLVGDPFLKNVLAVYDWEDTQMSFYPRQYYHS